MAIGDENPASAENLAILERRGKAIELRKTGLTYRAIAAELGVSGKTAYDDVMAELQQLNAEHQENADEVRRLELEKLDALETKTWAKLDNLTVNYPQTAMVVIRCMERRSRLLGLDAPTRTELSGKDGGPLRIQAAGPSDDEQMAHFARVVYDKHIEMGMTPEQAREMMRVMEFNEEHIPGGLNGDPLMLDAAKPPEVPADFRIESLLQVDNTPEQQDSEDI